MNTNVIKEYTVQPFMTRIVDHVYMNDSAADAVKLMIESGHTAIPVVDNNLRCVGILSRKDFTEMFIKEDQQLAEFFNSEPFDLSSRIMSSYETCSDLSVRDLMTHDVRTIANDTTLQSACQIMSSNEVHHLPVIDSNERLVGMFSSLDAIRFLADQGDAEFSSKK